MNKYPKPSPLSYKDHVFLAHFEGWDIWKPLPLPMGGGLYILVKEEKRWGFYGDDEKEIGYYNTPSWKNSGCYQACVSFYKYLELSKDPSISPNSR